MSLVKCQLSDVSSHWSKVRGFSIPELMLSVAIIGVLAAISLSLLNPVQAIKRSRDTIRFHDLNTLKSALILAIQNGSNFGNRCLPASPCDSLDGGTSVDGSGYVDLNLTGFINQLPPDPLFSQSSFKDALGQAVAPRYRFAHDNNGDFEIQAHLEAKDNASKYQSDGGNNDDYYEVGTKLDIL